MNNIKLLKKESYIKYLKAQRIFKEDYPKIIKNYEQTNNRFYVNNLFDEEKQDEIYDKCYIIYNTFNNKFEIKTISHFEIMPYETFNYDIAKKICKKLNEELKLSTYDELIMEHIILL